MTGSQFREDPFVLCPYYRKETPVEVRCVGYVGTHSTQVFRSKVEKEEWKYDFCCGNWQGCPHYQYVTIERGDL